MKDMDIFLDRLNQLATELEQLGRSYADLYKQYDGIEFENQQYLAADRLDNLILNATHEMASNIGFSAADIKKLTDFIEFRKEYKEFADKDLELIIDSENIPVKTKLELAQKLSHGDVHLLRKEMQNIRQLWHQKFENSTYRQIQNLLNKV